MKGITKKQRVLLLIGIIVIAAFFRFLNLGTNPAGLFRDEAEKAYTAYSLLKTGGYCRFIITPFEIQTEFIKHPIFIYDYKTLTSAIYQYSAIPFIAVLGLTELAARMPSALIGLLTVLLAFLLARELFGDWIGLGTAFLMAISPWHVIFSRWALQGIFLPLLIGGGVYLFYLGQSRREWWWVGSAILFGLAFYAYEVARLFVPLFLVAISVIYFGEIRKKPLAYLVGVLVFVIVCVPSIYVSLTTAGGARFDRISIFRDGMSVWRVIGEFIGNYVKHLSPGFLFIRGDELPRHGVISFGELYHFEAPFFLVGLITLLKRRGKVDLVLLVWFVLFPISSSLTRVGIPHALRTIYALPMPAIITMVGAERVFRWARREKLKGSEDEVEIRTSRESLIRIVAVLLIVVVIISVLGFGVDLFIYYPRYSALWWDYGVKQGLEFIESMRGAETKVFVSGYLTSKVYLLLLYKKVDPGALRDGGIDALGVDFLPSEVAIDEVWDKLPGGSLVMLYPGERLNQPAVAMVVAPLTARNAEPYPAFYIYQKD